MEAAPRPRYPAAGLPHSKRRYASWGPPRRPVGSFRCAHVAPMYLTDDVIGTLSLESKSEGTKINCNERHN